MGRGGAGGDRGRRLGLQPAGRGRGLPRPGPEARRGADADRARGHSRGLRRRRQAALGGGEGGRLGPGRARVRRQHPRHGRRRGADERQRLRRRAGAGAGVGHGLHRGGKRAPDARRARLPLPRLGHRRARGRRRGELRPGRGRRRGREGGDGRDAPQAQGGAALGDQDLRLHLRQPRRSQGRGTLGRTAAGRCGCPGVGAGRGQALAQARELRRERRQRDHGRRAGGDGGRRGCWSTSASGSLWSPRSRCSARSNGPTSGGCRSDRDEGAGLLAQGLAPAADRAGAGCAGAGGRLLVLAARLLAGGGRPTWR